MASFGKVSVWSSAGYGKSRNSSAGNRSSASGSTVSSTAGSDHDCVGSIGGKSYREPCTGPASRATAAGVVVPNAITTAATTSDEKQINLDQLLRRKRSTRQEFDPVVRPAVYETVIDPRVRSGVCEI